MSVRLWTELGNRGDHLGKTLCNYGHTYQFIASPNDKAVAFSDDESDSELEVIPSRIVPNDPELTYILFKSVKVKPPHEDGIIKWLEKVYKENRGLETMSGAKLSTTLSAQTTKWAGICLGYISDCIVMQHKFIVKALEHACSDERARKQIYDLIEDKILAGYKRAIKDTEFQVHVERTKTPSTQNGSYNQTMQTK